jgi:hypothetical protein
MTDRYVWVVTDTFTEFGGDRETTILYVADSLEAAIAHCRGGFRPRSGDLRDGRMGGLAAGVE